MELALYCPDCGYYDREKDSLGRRGDYYTSVSVGSLFGELLGWQFAEWLEPGRAAGRKIRIVEAGAHDGKLAGDLLAWLRQYRPALFEPLQYWIVEPSRRRRDWQRQNLAPFGDQVRWVAKLDELAPAASAAPRPQDSARGWEVIFSNELLDALPVHRLGWDAQKRAWFEWGVALEAGRFVWTRMADKAPAPGAPTAEELLAFSWPGLPLDNDLRERLPDGFSLEVCPDAAAWWRAAANALAGGKLVTIDYGLTAEELIRPERPAGTLRAYHRHQASHEVLAQPGEQDITAHVNFTAMQKAGESAGLQTEGLLTQAQFLTRIAAQTWAAENRFGAWTAARIRQFHTLTHPEYLGRSFRVLVQSRG